MSHTRCMHKTLFPCLFMAGFFFCSAFNIQVRAQQHDVPSPPATPIESQVIVLKLKEQHRDTWQMPGEGSRLISAICPGLALSEVKPFFPRHLPPDKEAPAYHPGWVDLSLIYRLENFDVSRNNILISRLISSGWFEYAEPLPLFEPLFIPNDEKLPNQYYLNKIRAFEAWDLCQGDTNVVVGIIDSGTDLDHEDLVDNLKYNYNDPIDGIDNDNDGFPDNYYGWDLGDMDYDPQVFPGGGNVSHGVQMCGIAGATTNNGIGVAGSGFRCKFLPVKINNADGQYLAGFEGIVYAADHGCKVINCSWGSPYSPGKFGQDIINYATFNRDALVVAASGNSDSEIPFFPASYGHVLSIGATGPYDERMLVTPGYATSFGIHLDLCAPGKDIFSTWDYPYFYKAQSGTSMAAALVSGAAALVRSRFPQYSALQTAEKLRVTADVIDTLPANLNFAGKLGMGRLNLSRALTDSLSPSVRFLDPVFSDLGDEVFTNGDTIQLTNSFINYLADAVDLNVTMQTEFPFIQIIDSTFFVSSLPSLATVSNQDAPFRFVVLSGAPDNYSIYFKLTYTSGIYTSFEYIEVLINSDIIDIQTDKLNTTLTSRGILGYNDTWHLQGKGFCFNNDLSRMFTGSLMVGSSITRVSDATYDANGSGFDMDFRKIERLTRDLQPGLADQEYTTRFDDEFAGSSKLGIHMTHRILSWDGLENANFLVHAFVIRNQGSGMIGNLYAGLFVDWDMQPFAPVYDRVEWDNEERMGITYSLEGGPVAGLALLEGSATVRQYAFDMDGASGSIRVDDGFTSQEKYNALRSHRPGAGNAVMGNNVANLVSSGPYLLLPGDSVRLTFCMLAAEHGQALSDALHQAKLKYFETPGIPSFSGQADQPPFKLVPNPSRGQTMLIPERKLEQDVQVQLFNHLGQLLFQTWLDPASPSLTIDGEAYLPGVYYLRLHAEQVWFLRWVKLR